MSIEMTIRAVGIVVTSVSTIVRVRHLAASKDTGIKKATAKPKVRLLI